MNKIDQMSAIEKMFDLIWSRVMDDLDLVDLVILSKATLLDYLAIKRVDLIHLDKMILICERRAKNEKEI